MPKATEHVLHARALRDDLLAAVTVWVPRREVIISWLDGFLQRAAAPAYRLGETEADDLAVLEVFLRRQKVPRLAR